MKYDKPVWQIMHLCADAMPAVFRYEDVRRWFTSHYPNVNEATIRAHLIGLTEGGRTKHVQFAPRSPVFRRVARGEYEPIAVAERGEQPNALVSTTPSAASDSAAGQAGRDRPRQLVPDVILLGSVGERAAVPAPAKDVFREPSFQLSRLDAELSGKEWFILSAEHGLVAPHEWISPDSRTLADMDPDYRVVWAAWVVTRLQSLIGDLEGKNVRVNAPDAFIGPLFADLQDAGAVVTSGIVAARPRAERETGSHPISMASVASAHLADGRYAAPASDLGSLPDEPGLYGWFVDQAGARNLNRCLMLPVRSGLVFVGQVGGSSWQAVADPVRNLRDELQHVQLHGQARDSTFRMLLATVLREHLGMSSLEDPCLTEWMLEHLSVSTWVSQNVGSLQGFEQLVVAELNPVLNIDHLAAAQYRNRLNQMRSNLV